MIMEILNNIWTALTTENEVLINIFSIPLTFIEAIVYMLLFTTILKIDSSKKQKSIYVLFATLMGILCTFFIPKPYSNIVTILLTPIAIKLIFKVSILKGIFAEFLPLVCVTVLEIILARVFLLIFGTSYEVCANIPLCRLFITLFIYLAVFLIAYFSKRYNFSIAIFDSMSKRNKRILFLNTLFAIVVIFMQMCTEPKN